MVSALKSPNMHSLSFIHLVNEQLVELFPTNFLATTDAIATHVRLNHVREPSMRQGTRHRFARGLRVDVDVVFARRRAAQAAGLARDADSSTVELAVENRSHHAHDVGRRLGRARRR